MWWLGLYFVIGVIFGIKKAEVDESIFWYVLLWPLMILFWVLVWLVDFGAGFIK